MRSVARTQDVSPSEVSPEDVATVRRLFEEVKRLYGRLGECLENGERSADLIEQIHAKEDAIAALVPSFGRDAARGRAT